jgi:2-polyprenyl-3-methyl-5-hydroxy-6-metoxy-1,4-benzoquinol methylase
MSTSSAVAKGIQCPVCFSSKVSIKEHWLEYEIYKCADCAGEFAWPLKVAEIQKYDEWYGDLSEPIYALRRISFVRHYRMFFHMVGQGKGRRLLDLACGSGFFMKMAQDRGYNVYGIDQSKVAIDYGRDKLGLSNMMVGMLEDAPFDWKDFDVITIFEVLEHLPDPHAMVKLARKFLKPGGILFVSTPNQERMDVRFGVRSSGDYPPKHLTRWKKETLERLFKQYEWESLAVAPSPLGIQYFLFYAIPSFFRKKRGTKIGSDVFAGKRSSAPKTGVSRLGKWLYRSYLSLIIGSVVNFLFWLARPLTRRMGWFDVSLVVRAQMPPSAK